MTFPPPLTHTTQLALPLLPSLSYITSLLHLQLLSSVPSLISPYFSYFTSPHYFYFHSYHSPNFPSRHFSSLYSPFPYFFAPIPPLCHIASPTSPPLIFLAFPTPLLLVSPHFTSSHFSNLHSSSTTSLFKTWTSLTYSHALLYKRSLHFPLCPPSLPYLTTLPYLQSFPPIYLHTLLTSPYSPYLTCPHFPYFALLHFAALSLHPFPS